MGRPQSSQAQKSSKNSKGPIEGSNYRSPISQITETDPSKIEFALRERSKELNCIYALAKLAERYSNAIDPILENFVNILTDFWQYPEIACASIVYDGRTYKSRGFKLSKWWQSAQIVMDNKPRGKLEVFYLKERPPADEGPFLKEERLLLDTLALGIGRLLMRISVQQELKRVNEQLIVKQKSLEEANTALRALVGRINEEKQEIYDRIQANIDKIILPMLNNELARGLPEDQREYVELLKAQLEKITSPFINTLSRNFLSLTPTEIKICNMIREGMRTKEIAQLHGVSQAAIHRHREHIRQKLKIANTDINLTTFLQSSMWQKDS
jgi:DNA-binding NarL/FixJ family response regulator